MKDKLITDVEVIWVQSLKCTTVIDCDCTPDKPGPSVELMLRLYNEHLVRCLDNLIPKLILFLCNVCSFSKQT